MTAKTVTCRATLRLGTALAAVLVVWMPATSAHAQELPLGGNVVIGTATINNGTPGGGTTTVKVNGPATNNPVINWDSFSVGQSDAVKFIVSGGNTHTVVNRVIGTTVGADTTIAPSLIDGKITAEPGINLWLINPAGVTFSATGTFNGASLVLSTLDGPATFPGSSASTQFKPYTLGTGVVLSGSATQAITLAAGSVLTSSGDVILLGKQIDVGGTITSTGGAISLVAAQDVTFTSGLDSPLSYTINTGTALSGVHVLATGTLSGTSVALGAVSQVGAIADLLRVDGGATLTAVDINGVVILATKSVGGVGGIVITGKGDGIDFTGSATGGIIATGTAAAVTLAADGALQLTGRVSAANGTSSLSASGSSIALASTAIKTGGTQTYTGPVTLLSDTTLQGTTVSFAGSVDSDATATARSLGITGDATFDGAVGVGTALKSLSVSGTTALNGGFVTTTGTQTYTGAVTLGMNTVLDSSAGNGIIALNGGLIGGGKDLTINTGTANQSYNGLSGIGTLTLTTSGTKTLNTGTYGWTTLAGGALSAVTTNGTLTLNQATTFGAVTLGSATVFDSSLVGGNLVFGAVTGAGKNLGVTTGTGAIALNGQAGGAGALGAVSLTGGTVTTAGTITSSSAVKITAETTATLAAISAAGQTVTVSAAKLVLNGTNYTATTLNLIDKGPSGNTLQVGDGVPNPGGFQLSSADINKLSVTNLVLDAGTAATNQNVAIGSLALTNPALKSLSVYGLQRIDITGNLTKGVGSGLAAVQLGGTGMVGGLASVVRVAATSDGTGGMINVGDATLELRGKQIGVGQDTGFLDHIGVTAGSGATQTPQFMVNNAVSSLYDATIGGGKQYTAAGQTVIAAKSLTVRYADFALFQNTGIAGSATLNAGVSLSPGVSPSSPALVLIGPNPPDAGPFAIFGKINSTVDTATAVLGNQFISVSAVIRPTARINGCVIGSAAGCLNAISLTPSLGSFAPARSTILIANNNFEIPFDPLVATNNDSLFGDVGTFGIGDISEVATECPPDTKAPCDADQRNPSK